MSSIDEANNLLLLAYVLFSFTAFLVYTFFHLATSYRYYDVRNRHRNWLLELLFLIFLAVSNLMIGLYMYRINRPKDNSEYIFFILAGYNLLIAIDIYLWEERYKDRLLLGMYTDEIRERVINNINKESFWENVHDLLNSFSEDNNLYKDDNLIRLAVLNKSHQRLMRFHTSIPDSIKNHPNFPEFERSVYNTKLEEILQRIGIDTMR